MRFVWLIFAGLLAAIALILPRLNRHADLARPGASTVPVMDSAGKATSPARPSSSFVALREPPTATDAARADSIVAFGLAQQGTPYTWAGTSPLTGFDCSGFILYTFAHFNVGVPHSTALLIAVGRPVSRAEASPGDIVVFTGTATTSTTPGHAGIVVSNRGELPLRFVHSSSARRESGVKVSHVEGTDYERRFMQVRRVLGPGAPVAAVAPEALPSTSKAAPTAAISPRRVAVVPDTMPVKLLPVALAPKKKAAIATVRRRVYFRSKKATVPVAKKPLATKKTAARKAASPKKPASKKAASPKTKKHAVSAKTARAVPKRRTAR